MKLTVKAKDVAETRRAVIRILGKTRMHHVEITKGEAGIKIFLDDELTLDFASVHQLETEAVALTVLYAHTFPMATIALGVP